MGSSGRGLSEILSLGGYSIEELVSRLRRMSSSGSVLGSAGALAEACGSGLVVFGRWLRIVESGGVFCVLV